LRGNIFKFWRAKMNLNTLKISLLSFIGVVGSTIAQLFGGWSADLTTLLICMLADYITGIVVAAYFNNSPKTENGALSSKAGFKGLAKKIAILLCVIIAYRLDVTLNISYIKTAVIIAFIANETISIVENIGLMGIPIPPAILKAIDVLKNKKEND